MPVNVRTFTAATYALELGGVAAGFLASATGGDAVGSVVIEGTAGGSAWPNKHLGNVSYEDIQITVTHAPTGALLDWINGFLGTKAPSMDGAILILDFNHHVVERLEFTNARISQITVPALDGSSKAAVALAISFRPELTRRVTGSGTALNLTRTAAPLSSGMFRLSLDKLDTSGVASIDAITISQALVRDEIGILRGPVDVAGNLDVTNVRFMVSAAKAEPFWAWHEDFVIKGNNDEAAERNGELTLLAVDAQTSLLTFGFAGVGVVRVSSLADLGKSTDVIARTTVEVYVEQVSLKS